MCLHFELGHYNDITQTHDLSCCALVVYALHPCWCNGINVKSMVVTLCYFANLPKTTEFSVNKIYQMPKIDAKMFLVRKLAPRIPTELRCLSTWASSLIQACIFWKNRYNFNWLLTDAHNLVYLVIHLSALAPRLQIYMVTFVDIVKIM